MAHEEPRRRRRRPSLLQSDERRVHAVRRGADDDARQAVLLGGAAALLGAAGADHFAEARVLRLREIRGVWGVDAGAAVSGAAASGAGLGGRRRERREGWKRAQGAGRRSSAGRKAGGNEMVRKRSRCGGRGREVCVRASRVSTRRAQEHLGNVLDQPRRDELLRL